MKKIAEWSMLGIMISFLVGPLTAVPAEAILIWGTDASSELVGIRTNEANGGIITENWGGQGDFMLNWVITQTENGWRYQYTFNAAIPAVSHFLLEVTEDDNPFNILSGSDEPFEGPKLWIEGRMPNSLYGLKFDLGGYNPITYTLVTDRSPVYGVFAAKGGSDSWAYSSALNYSDYKTNVRSLTSTDFIARPNGIIPEPGTWFLLGGGLVGLLAFGIKRRS